MNAPDRPLVATSTRNHGVDCLRGISIAVVLVLHFYAIHRWAGGETAKWLGRNGYYGVSAFFVISGYLITSHALQHGDGDLRRLRGSAFYRMRFARIAPPFLIVLAVLIALALSSVQNFHLGPFVSLGSAVAHALTFTFNVLYAHTYAAHATFIILPWLVLWSLSVEEVFYLAFPAFCFVFGRFPTIPLLALAISGPVHRYAGGALPDYFSNFDGLAIGCLLALILWRARSSALSPLAAIGLGASAAILLVGTYLGAQVGNNIVWGPTLIELSIAALIVVAVMPCGLQFPKLGWSLLSPLRLAGRYSYEIYLLHGIVIYGLHAAAHQYGYKTWPLPPLNALGVDPGNQVFILFLAITLPASVIFGKCISEPLNRALRRRPVMPSTELAARGRALAAVHLGRFSAALHPRPIAAAEHSPRGRW